MESVIFEGKEYIKVSVLAERFRYTSDYLGQLCRGKKVDARLIGRAWYINLVSLENHRNSKYKQKVSSEITSQKPIKNYLSRIDIEPILKKKTVTILKSNHGVMSRVPVKYEGDDYALIPKMHKDAVSKVVPIMLAGSHAVKVHKGEASLIEFKPEALPEVFLAGTIKVHQIKEEIEETKKTQENPVQQVKPSDIALSVPSAEKVTGKKIVIRQSTAAPRPVLSNQTNFLKHPEKAAIDIVPISPKHSLAQSEIKTFKPTLVVAKEIQKTHNPPTTKISNTFLFVVTFFASAVAFSLLCLSSVTFTDGAAGTSGIYVQFKTLHIFSDFLRTIFIHI